SLAAKVDLSGYPADSAIRIEHKDGRLLIAWPSGSEETGEMALDLSGQRPLIERIAVRRGKEEPRTILTGVDPAVFVTIGSRNMPPGKPSEQKWEVFFDNPARRPHRAEASQFELQDVRVTGNAARATVEVGSLRVGPFSGEWVFTFFADARIVKLDARLQTSEDGLAIFYDAGLLASEPSWQSVAWRDTRGRMQSEASTATAHPVKVRHRTI